MLPFINYQDTTACHCLGDAHAVYYLIKECNNLKIEPARESEVISITVVCGQKLWFYGEIKL